MSVIRKRIQAMQYTRSASPISVLLLDSKTQGSAQQVHSRTDYGAIGFRLIRLGFDYFQADLPLFSCLYSGTPPSLKILADYLYHGRVRHPQNTRRAGVVR